MRGVLLRWLVLTAAVLAASWLLDGIRVDGLFSALLAAAPLGILNAFLRPLLILLTLPVNILTLGLFTFVINALMLQIVSAVIPGFTVHGILDRRFRRPDHRRGELAPEHLYRRTGEGGADDLHRSAEEGRPMGVNDLTPAMRQYVEVKERYPDCILFFRMGDFYEMFFEDAVTASRILEITLTSRNKNSKDAIPLCGFPYHAASVYIAKLIEKGFKVAVCEQMEDPKLAKGVVKREVVRVVTPGLVLDTENLHAKENNFLAALVVRGGRFGLAFVDISTGEFRVTEAEDRDYFLAETAGLEIRELLVPEDLRDDDLIRIIAGDEERCLINRFPPERFDPEAAIERLRDQFPAERLAAIDVSNPPGNGRCGRRRPRLYDRDAEGPSRPHQRSHLV